MELNFKLTGSIVPLVTPMTVDGNIDVDAVRSLVKFQINNGTNAIFLFGTCGEGDFLNRKHKELMIKEVFKCIAGSNLSVLIGVDGENTDEVLEQKNILKGASALVIRPPVYSFTSENSLRYSEHVKVISGSLNLPIILYNYPKASVNTFIPVEIIKELIISASVVGIKDSSGDIEFLNQLIMLKREHPDFGVINGELRLAAKALSSGVDGLAMSFTNIDPRACIDMMAASKDGDTARVGQFQRSFVDLWDCFPSQSPPFSKVKALLSGLGYCKPYCCDSDKNIEPDNCDFIREYCHDIS